MEIGVLIYVFSNSNFIFAKFICIKLFFTSLGGSKYPLLKRECTGPHSQEYGEWYGGAVRPCTTRPRIPKIYRCSSLKFSDMIAEILRNGALKLLGALSVGTVTVLEEKNYRLILKSQK